MTTKGYQRMKIRRELRCRINVKSAIIIIETDNLGAGNCAGLSPIAGGEWFRVAQYLVEGINTLSSSFLFCTHYDNGTYSQNCKMAAGGPVIVIV